MIQEEALNEILELLKGMQEEDNIPKNIKSKLREIHSCLLEDEALAIKIDKSIQGLDEIAEDQFVPVHVRTQIWDVVSRLECI